MALATRPLFLVLLLAGGLHSPSAAQSQKITLRLQNVTATEAAEALSQAAALPISIDVPPPADGPKSPEIAKLEVRANFDWKQTPFRRALGELCSHFGLVILQRWQGAYRLAPGAPAPPVGPPVNRVGLFEKQGMQVWASGIQVSSTRSLGFQAGAAAIDRNENTNLTLTLAGTVGEEDAARIAAIEGVTAKDDRGNLLVSNGNWMGGGGLGIGATGDGWNGMVVLGGPHPKATKLTWVEGEVMAFRTYRTFQIELPLAASEKSLSRSTPEATLEVTHFDPSPPDAGDGNATGGPFLRASVFLPTEAGAALQSDGGTNVGPFLVGKSGKLYAPAGFSSSGNGNAEGMRFDLTCNFPPVQEAVVKVLLPLAIRRDPQPLFSFRMTNIPLPIAAGFVAQAPQPRFQVPGAPPVTPAPNPDSKSSSTLVSQVLVGSMAAAEGTLSVGLARKAANGWGAVRWQEIPVEKDGMARLSGVQPGSYRLLRIYRAKEATRGVNEGSWQNSETIVEIVPDKELTAPPLQWTLDPPVTQSKPKKPSKVTPPPAQKTPLRNRR